MYPTQINFYQSLSEKEQHILNVAALKGFGITASNITQLVKLRMSIQTKDIEHCLNVAVKRGLFISNNQYSKEFQAEASFIIYIYPQLKDYQEEWELINSQSYYFYGNPPIKFLKNYLYNILYAKKNYFTAENEFIQCAFNDFSNDLVAIFDYESYKDVIPLMSNTIIETLISIEVSRGFEKMDPLPDIQTKLEALKSFLSLEKSSGMPSLTSKTLFLSGDLEASQQIFNSTNSLFVFNNSAIKFLLEGNTKSALIGFEKAMKNQRSTFRGTQLPLLPEVAFYYLTALLSVDPVLSAPVFQKINKELLKKVTGPYDYTFMPVGFYALNDKSTVATFIESLNDNLYSSTQGYKSLLCLLVMFLIDKRPDTMVFASLNKLIQKAFANGYKIMAYEAAYVLTQWVHNKDSKELYTQIAANFTFEPALSHISRQEEWEKSLNTFLSITKGKAGSSAKDDTAKHRVVYYLNFKNSEIQPVLQTRTAKGVWTSGRNIAMKTFNHCSVEGMTDQDIRLAKSIKVSNSYYGSDDYYFPGDSIKFLVGHPFLFLHGTNDISVELIAAQPVLRVMKTANGYTLSTDIKTSSERLIVEKETNTRYKIYDLTNQQLVIIRAIQDQKIVVPDQGKDKLMQVLGNFSSHMTVYSDLLATDNTKVKKVATDSRIRVQLLPLGDGLKAELFAKPFGSHPPYCKPGKGGKTLIANENGEQLQVTRNLTQESDFSDELLTQIQALESIDMSDDLIAFDDPMDSLHLLDILAAHPDKCIVEWPEGERFKIRGSVNFSNLNLKIKSKSNWFELQGEIKVDENTVITIQQLLELTAKGHNRFIELGQGEFLALSDKLKKQLDELRTFSSVGKDGLQINKFASVALGDFFDDVENLKTDKSWKEFQQRLEMVQNVDTQIPSNLQAELRPYQEEGFRWLSRLAEWEGGACLADDMGLGKTVQTLAILLHRAQAGAALVVCPVSVIPNWISETEKFAPTLNVKILTNGNREQIFQNLEPGDLLVTSYGLLQSEGKAFADITFATIVLDEAHTIKNYTTKTSKAAMQLQAPFRVALTGTPIQNHLGEVWNLFNFINPGLLGSLSHFTDTFIKSDNDHARKHLKKLIAPFILRRLKSTVLDELPPKTEIVKKVQLSDEEMAFYEALRRQAIANLESDDSTQGTKQLKALAEITRLRQACCNPALVDPTLNIGSAKLSAFLEIVEELIENKHKALVFSQFVKHLTLVRAELDKRGIKYQYLDGSSPMHEREQSVKKFQGGEGDLFLISLKAGGLGLNLTAADYVIHMDPWWNPAVEDQASDRAHRFGQTRPVTIYRLVAENTIEEKIIQLHNTKRDLAESLLEGSDQSARLSITELVSLIKDRD